MNSSNSKVVLQVRHNPAQEAVGAGVTEEHVGDTTGRGSHVELPLQSQPLMGHRDVKDESAGHAANAPSRGPCKLQAVVVAKGMPGPVKGRQEQTRPGVPCVQHWQQSLKHMPQKARQAHMFGDVGAACHEACSP